MPLTNYAFADLITFTRSTTGTFVGSNGLIQSAAINAPRFDFDPVTLAPLGLLIEEQRVNLALYSAEFDNATWSKTNITITANAVTSPDGTVNADAFVEDTATSTHLTSQAVTIADSTTFTVSCYVKAAGRSWIAVAAVDKGGTANRVWFNVSTGAQGTTNGTVLGFSAVNAGNGWYRIVVSASSATGGSGASIRINAGSADNTPSFTGNGTASFYLYGAQVEVGAFGTSYIPTVASTVTRTADNAAITGANFSPWFNANEGTFVAQWRQGAVSGTRTVMAANDGTSNQSIRLRTVTTDPFFTVTNGGIDQANIDAGTVAGSTVYKMAGCYRANDFATVIGGGTVVTDTSGTIPTVNQLMLGTSAASNYLNGHLRNITYYPTRLTDAQLQALTA